MIESNHSAAAAATRHSVDAMLPFERLLTDVSSRFIDWPTGRIDEAINDGLRQIVETLDIDRSTLSSVNPNTGQFHSTHSWAALGFKPVATTVSSRTYPWATPRFRAGLPVVFSSLEELPPEAVLDRQSYASLGLRSHVGMPVMVSGELVAVLGFGSLRSERSWGEDLVARMRLLADLFGSALARKRAHDRIDQLLRFERLLADLSASLLGSAADDLGAAVQEALNAVATLLGVEHAALWELAPAPVRLVATDESAADGALPLLRQLSAAEVPWVLQQVVAGNVINSTGVDGFPPAAGADVAALRSAGANSFLVMPLRGKEAVIGALWLSSGDAERVWRDEKVARLTLFGTMLLNALAHRNAERSAQRATAETAQTRERLAHLARVEAVGAMTAAVAHEINQPLMAITNYTLAGRRRLDGDGQIDRAKIRDLLEKIAGQTALAGQVLDHLRTMVKRRDAQEMEIDLSQLLGKSLKLIEMEARMRDIHVETAIAADLPRALGDEIQVQQVILNLASNAMDAMAATPTDDRKLHLEATSSDDDSILICIADHGTGIVSADEQRVFEPFYTTKGMGLGIGLSICRQIVEAHGGKLWHEVNAGGGTIFRFTLPTATQGA
jgi:signal transduction histidine kinase